MARSSLAIYIGCALVIWSQSAAAQVATTNNISIFGDSTLRAYYSYPDGGYSAHSFSINPLPDGNIALHETLITAGLQSYWMIVSDGIVFDATNALSYRSLFASEVFPDQVFTLGVVIDAGMYGVLDSPDKFGWAHIEYRTNETPHFVITDSAVAPAGGYGIITGTTTVVAEPTSFFLAAIGLIGVAPGARTLRRIFGEQHLSTAALRQPSARR
jgi:hypothetical protein